MHSNDSNIKRELVYPEFSYKLTGIFYEIHNKLGRHLLEKQYADAFEIVLKKFNIPYEREVRLYIDYHGKNIPAGFVDFIVDNKIAVDFKAKKFVTKDDYNQMLRYLKARSFHLGLIVNFRSTYLKPKRILNNDFKKK
mgnify:CR=1 FL=1